MNIAVAGTGYVGLSLAVLLSQHHRVSAVDVVPEKAEALFGREFPIRDPELVPEGLIGPDPPMAKQLVVVPSACYKAGGAISPDPILPSLPQKLFNRCGDLGSAAHAHLGVDVFDERLHS